MVSVVVVRGGNVRPDWFIITVLGGPVRVRGNHAQNSKGLESPGWPLPLSLQLFYPYPPPLAPAAPLPFCGRTRTYTEKCISLCGVCVMKINWCTAATLWWSVSLQEQPQWMAASSNVSWWSPLKDNYFFWMDLWKPSQFHTPGDCKPRRFFGSIVCLQCFRCF